jgi:uncharacterized repeat protein (TIGR01451 family)
VIDDGPHSKLFEDFSRALLKDGAYVRFQARGSSMSPAIQNGEIVYIREATPARLRRGDIVLVKGDAGFRLHRLIVADTDRDMFITRGDCGEQDDPVVHGQAIMGIAVAKEVRVGEKMVRAKLRGMGGCFVRGVADGQRIVRRILRTTDKRSSSRVRSSRSGRRRSRALPGALGLLFVLLASPHAFSQVAVDATTSAAANPAGAGTATLSFAHTTSAAANRLLIVGVSINITNNSGTAVTGVTYNGAALTLVGAHNDTSLTRRVEMWQLLAPATGTFNVVVSVNVPTAVTVGVAAGATTFTGVDQTVPLGNFASADGAGGTNSQLDVPGVVNGMVLDTLAIAGNLTATVPAPQVSQWNLRSSSTANPGVRAAGTSRAGAPSVPIAETFTASNWAQGAVSVNPTAADVGVSTSVATVQLGQNSVYNITVSNNGPSAANTITLTDTLAAGLTFVSVTSPTMTCAGTGPVTCTLATLASGATATAAITVTAGAAGSFANTATVTDSGTPPDPNTGNNSYVAVATVQTISCAIVSQANPGGNLTGTINTYYPGTASVAAGATSIPVGAPTGAGTIALGNLLLVIQMQDASINTSNNVAYGNGSNGAGFTALNSAGNYEFVRATGPVSGGSVPITGAGSGGGLVFAYNASAASATKGRSTYQVVLIPQYTTATLTSTLVATPWNGSIGGVLALDASGTLTLNGATVSVDGRGFRGGAGMQFNGGVGGANTDYVQSAPATYTGALENGVDAPKGEGVAGTPFWVESGGTFANGNSSYPSGTAGVDGSMARGAPANGGGGGTDADQTANSQNAGGGGGGNGGNGGFGGDSWNSNLSVGGEGGAAFPATINRLAMGGGGGAGTRNNSPGIAQASSGAAGGGIIIIRAQALSGTATLTANGASAFNGTANDAGGGGGAGGSIVVLSASGGESGFTLQAQGGRGGDAWDTQAYTLANRHGPGGGGGGGVVLISGAPASISVNGGDPGTTLNPGVTYGATAGAAGASATNASISSTSGTQSGAQCTPDMSLSKTHAGNFVRGSTASYTVAVSNVSPYGATSGTVTVTDTLPAGLTPSTASGSGWSCSIASQTVTCTRANSLAANSSYPSITITSSVAQAAPATFTNTAQVAGGGEADLANDSSADVANVVSIADVSIVKAATPNPSVPQGSALTYTLTVTNNGPSSATNVTVTDALPSAVNYLTATTTAGTCSQNSGTVTCLLGTMTTGSTNVVTIATQAGSPGTVSNTATVTADQTDSDASNNSSTQSETITSPTQVELQSFTAQQGIDNSGASRIVLSWKTGGEARNLGFNVYREQNGGERVRLNPSLIAGSALRMREALPQHSGKTYSWIDRSASGGEYWLEDLDINGMRTMHGPIAVEPVAPLTDSGLASAPMISQLNQSQPSESSSEVSHPVESVLGDFAADARQIQKQFEIAAHPAVKIMVEHEGWHRITQPELVKAGLDANVNPAGLRLYAEAVEQPIQITGARAGPGGFGPQAAINFYGTGIDTQYSGKRVYWLVAEEGRGARIRRLPAASGSNQADASFPYAAELRQRTTYFAALLTDNGDNFFGAFVSPTPVEQVLHVPHLEKNSSQPAKLEIVLQGVMEGIVHEVTVVLNDLPLGDLTFTGQEKGKFRMNLPPGALRNWNNTITLKSQNGDLDTSLVDYIRIVYPHAYVADSDQLKFSGRAGDAVRVTGFERAPSVVLDITDPDEPVQLTPVITAKDGDYELEVEVPWLNADSAASARHTLLALAGDRILSSAGLQPNHPSHWHSAQAGADIVMVSAVGFKESLEPLLRVHRAEGETSAVIPITELYDEFTFGERSPYAIRQLLLAANKNWKTAPRYLLLHGRASVDPRNYLGFGHLDLVPTKIVKTSSLMTASDDWFSDFDDSGIPTIATGRLPVSTTDEAKTVVGKIAAYEGQSTNGVWTRQALIVADRNDTEDFTQDSRMVQDHLPANLHVRDVFTTTVGVAAAKQQIVAAINSGQLLVNYIGHGSEEQWSGTNLLDNKAVGLLTNGSRLPVFLIMNCLNGLFQDVYMQPLGVALELAPNGGAVAVVTSSGLNQPGPQTNLDRLIVQNALSGSQLALGDAVREAKSHIEDVEVRKTYVLLGDPAMRIKPPVDGAK